MNKYDDTDYLIEREESIEYEEGSDINVGSMEKDIKRCEELIKPQHANWIGISNQLAIAHVVDRVKELEEERQLVGMPVKNKRDGRIGVVLHQWESGSVAVLENINPRIINTHDNWSTLEILTDEVKQTQTKCDSIPVQKVKDKIEELKERKYNLIYTQPLETIKRINAQIKVLEELSEEK